MTPQDLEIYRLRLRVGLLERFCCNTLVGLVMTAGENLEGARMILETSLDDAEIEMRPAIPTSSDPASARARQLEASDLQQSRPSPQQSSKGGRNPKARA